MWRPEEPRPCCSAYSSSAHRHALLLLPSGWEGERGRTPVPLTCNEGSLHASSRAVHPPHGLCSYARWIFLEVNFLDLRRARLYRFKPQSRASRLGSRSCAHIGFLLFEFSSSVGKSSAAFSLLDAAPCVVIWRATGERRSAQRLSRRSE